MSIFYHAKGDLAKMKLLMVSPLTATLNDQYYSPVEKQVYIIAQELAKNHEITIACLKGSTVPGCKLIETQEHDESKAFETYKSELRTYDAVLDFSNLKYTYLYKHEKKPDLPLYGVCYPYQASGYNTAPPIPFPCMIGTSDAMCKSMIAKLGCMFKKVHYAPMPPPTESQLGPRSDRLLFLGRIEKGKGASIAIDLARQLRVGLDVIGEDIITSDQRNTVLLLQKADGRLVNIYGRVTEQVKHEFLSRAKALILPYVEDLSAWTCQTILEAYQHGTPVITLNKGAVSEFVENGETGYVCNSLDELPAAIDNINAGAYSAEKCIITAKALSAQAAAHDYELLLKAEPW